MAKYKVRFSGFAYVEADDPAEAEEKLEDEDYVYLEYGVREVLKVDDFVVGV